MNITENFLTNNDCYIENERIIVRGLMLHSVACPQPNASVFVRNWNKSGVEKCVHAFIDGLTGDVYQTLPWNMRGWHCGDKANDTHIGVEMCEPDCIKYTVGADFTCSDLNRAREIATRTYNSAVELFARLCKEYNLNPLEEGVIISHSEGYKKGVASNHADCEHLWKGLELPYTMDTLRRDVSSRLNKENNTIYRVQVGAFSKRENAENQLKLLKDAGFDGFIVEVGNTNVEVPTPTLNVGDKVRVINAITYQGNTFKAWYDIYDVIEVRGDRVVIGVDGVIAAAVNISNIQKV